MRNIKFFHFNRIHIRALLTITHAMLGKKTKVGFNHKHDYLSFTIQPKKQARGSTVTGEFPCSCFMIGNGNSTVYPKLANSFLLLINHTQLFMSKDRHMYLNYKLMSFLYKLYKVIRTQKIRSEGDDTAPSCPLSSRHYSSDFVSFFPL